MLQLKNIAVVSFVFLITLFVQDASAQRSERANIVEKLKTHIELTAEQETELNTISEKYRVRIEGLRNNENERGENRDKIKQLRQAQRAEINKVLTAEQEATLREKKSAHRAERKEKWSAVDKEGMRAELKKYREENITPVLAAQRAELENKISVADRATLAELRLVLNKDKAQRKDGKMKGQRPSKEERAAQRDAFEREHARELATLQTLIQKYSAELASIRNAIQPQMEQWKADTKAITQKYLADGKMENDRHGKHKGRKLGNNLRGEKAQGRFLLMNPNL